MATKFGHPNKPAELCLMNALTNWFVQGMPDALTYNGYISHIEELLANNKTTGANQSELYVNFTRLNLQRMSRIYKTYAPNAELLEAVKRLPAQTWVVITEAWCGDAAQSVPLIARLAEANEHIALKLILRDQNPAIMDLYLTDGGKGIPIWIALGNEGNELFHWGPRPEPAQQMVRDYKAMEEPKPAYLDFAETVQRWYAADRGATFSDEALRCFSTAEQA
jgi:hypothetical protein